MHTHTYIYTHTVPVGMPSAVFSSSERSPGFLWLMRVSNS